MLDAHRRLRMADTMPGPLEHNEVEGLIIAVLGLGYVGTPVAAACCGAGHRVIGIDIDASRLEVLRDGDVGPDTFSLRRALDEQRLHLTTQARALAEADVVFFCVPTPLEEGTIRHEALRRCAAEFARHGRSDALVIVESTVQPGFIRTLRPLLGHGGQVALAYCPERIDPALARRGMGLADVPRLVAGFDRTAQERAVQALHDLGISVKPVSIGVAEYAKLLENAFRLVNIAFIDQLAALLRAEGLCPREVVDAARTKPYGFQAFYPGIGAGGHCIAVDPGFLLQRAEQLGVELPLLAGALASNASRPAEVAGATAARTQPGSTVLVVGLTYKAGVADMRESAALVAARTLAGMNRRVIAWDPLVSPPDDLEATSLETGLQLADAVLVLVEPPPDVSLALLRADRPLLDATATLHAAEAL